MLPGLEKTPFSKWAALSIFLIALGVYGSLSGVLPLSWIWFAVGGGGAIWCQFNFETLKCSLARMKPGSWKFIILALILSYVTTTIAMIFGQFVLGIHFTANANGNFSGPMLGRIISLLKITFSLVGEELITAAVAFPLYHLASKKLPAQWAWIVASVVSSLLFGLMHFKIYHGNLYQCLVVIGLTRLPFNYAWRKADSLWAGIIAHIIYDWIIFVPAMLTG